MRPFRALTLVAGFVVAVGASVGSEPDAIQSVTATGGKVTYDKIAKKKLVGGVVLKGGKVTDATMKDLLEFTALTTVELQDAPKVTAAGIADLGKVKKLQKVEIQGAVVTDEAAKALAAATTITELRLTGGALTDDGVKALAALTKLQTLTLTQAKKVKGTTVPALVAAKDLNYLTVTECQLGDLAGWGALKKNAKLTTLSLTKAGVTDAGLKEIGQLAQLASLSLDGCPVTETGLAELARLRALRSLRLMDVKLSEKAVTVLSGLKQLTYLGVSETQIGKGDAEALKKALPKCDVEVAK
jgi:hypothetical protein